MNQRSLRSLTEEELRQLRTGEKSYGLTVVDMYEVRLPHELKVADPGEPGRVVISSNKNVIPSSADTVNNVALGRDEMRTHEYRIPSISNAA